MATLSFAPWGGLGAENWPDLFAQASSQQRVLGGVYLWGHLRLHFHKPAQEQREPSALLGTLGKTPAHLGEFAWSRAQDGHPGNPFKCVIYLYERQKKRGRASLCFTPQMTTTARVGQAGLEPGAPAQFCVSSRGPAPGPPPCPGRSWGGSSAPLDSASAPYCCGEGTWARSNGGVPGGLLAHCATNGAAQSWAGWGTAGCLGIVTQEPAWSPFLEPPRKPSPTGIAGSEERPPQASIQVRAWGEWGQMLLRVPGPSVPEPGSGPWAPGPVWETQLELLVPD